VFYRERCGVLPGSWTALAYAPRSQTPAGPPARPPGLRSRRRSTDGDGPCVLLFRGSITRLARPLCTLHCSVTRHSATLGSGWWSAFPGGACTRRAASRTSMFLCHLPSSQAWPGAPAVSN
jgi:hypothetical protein